MTDRPRAGVTLDRGTFIFGALLGFITGGIYALFNAPRSGRALRQGFTEGVENTVESTRLSVQDRVETTVQSVQERVEAIVPRDPMEESLDAGREAARRRRLELGLEP